MIVTFHIIHIFRAGFLSAAVCFHIAVFLLLSADELNTSLVPGCEITSEGRSGLFVQPDVSLRIIRVTH